MAVSLFVGNDNWIYVDGLVSKSLSGDTFENSATVTAQVKDLSGANIGSAVTLSYIAASNGDYEGTIPDTLAITAGVVYQVEVTADAGAGKKAVWTEKVPAQTRVFAQ